jgi:transcriptional regulator with XRE-family HTH domain
LVEAAEKTGVGRDTLSDLERGRRHPVMPTLAKIARGYGVPVEELLEEPAGFAELAGKAEAPQETGRATTTEPLTSPLHEERREDPGVTSALETIRRFLRSRTGTNWIALPDAEWDQWWLGAPRDEVSGRYEDIEAEWQLLKYEMEAFGKGEPSIMTQINDLTEVWGKLWARAIEARFYRPHEGESEKEFQRRRLEGRAFRSFYEPLEVVWPKPEQPPQKQKQA